MWWVVCIELHTDLRLLDQPTQLDATERMFNQDLHCLPLIKQLSDISPGSQLLCFRHLSESRFLLGAVHRRSEFASFCHDLMQNHLSKLHVPMHKQSYSSHFLKRNKTFSLFLIVKMNANYAEICRVGNMAADFQNVPLVHFFLKVSKYCCETPIIQFQQWKVKHINIFS